MLLSILVGFLGALIPEWLAIHNMRYIEKESRPNWIRSPFYWVVIFIMAILGGVVVFAYSYCLGYPLNIILSAQVGASTPWLLQHWTKNKIDIN